MGWASRVKGRSLFVISLLALPLVIFGSVLNLETPIRTKFIQYGICSRSLIHLCLICGSLGTFLPYGVEFRVH